MLYLQFVSLHKPACLWATGDSAGAIIAGAGRGQLNTIGLFWLIFLSKGISNWPMSCLRCLMTLLWAALMRCQGMSSRFRPRFGIVHSRNYQYHMMQALLSRWRAAVSSHIVTPRLDIWGSCTLFLISSSSCSLAWLREIEIELTGPLPWSTWFQNWLFNQSNHLEHHGFMAGRAITWQTHFVPTATRFY